MDIIYRINGGALTLLANQTSPTNISGTAGDSVEVWLSEKQTATVQAAAGTPEIAFVYNGENTGTNTTHTFSVGSALSAGDYILFAHLDQSGVTIDSATLEGSAMSAFTSNTATVNGHTTSAFYITGLAGGGNQQIAVTLSGSTANLCVTLSRVVAGTIDTTAQQSAAESSNPDLSFTFTNTDDELIVVGWAKSGATFVGYTGGLTNVVAEMAGAELTYYLASVQCSAGSPDTVGVDLTATTGRGYGVAVRIS